MSHVVALNWVVKDLEVLKQVAASLGLEFRENQKTWKWYGQWVNDYDKADAAYHRGVKPEQYGHGQHALRVKGNSNAYEVGVIETKPGEYTLAWDFYAGGKGLMDKIGKDGQKLLQGYSSAIARLELDAAAMTRQLQEQGLLDRADSLEYSEYEENGVWYHELVSVEVR